MDVGWLRSLPASEVAQQLQQARHVAVFVIYSTRLGLVPIIRMADSIQAE